MYQHVIECYLGSERDCRADITERCGLLPRAHDWVSSQQGGYLDN